jgi:hypothetical protein
VYLIKNMTNFIRQTNSRDQRDPNKTLDQRNRGILKRIASADGATVEDLGTHPDLKLRPGDDRDVIIASVRETSARINKFTIVESKPEETTVTLDPIKSTELSPELTAGLEQIHKDFDSLPLLHPGIEWADVEKSLRVDQATLRELIEDNKDGFSMNVFGEEDGSFHFASAWTDYRNIKSEYRNIIFDKEANPAFNGRNAVAIANDRRAKMSPRSINQQLIIATSNISGWCWYETDEATRKSGDAVFGYDLGVVKISPNCRDTDGSLRFSRRVKKA